MSKSGFLLFSALLLLAGQSPVRGQGWSPSWIRSETATGGGLRTDIVYYDQFGYERERVELSGSGSGGSLVSWTESDYLHHPLRTYLPYPVTGANSGSYVPNPSPVQALFYRNLYSLQAGHEKAYALTYREHTPDGRVLSEYLPGEEYQSDSTRATRHAFLGNASGAVLRLTVDGGGTLSAPGYYLAGMLTSDESVDADSLTVRTWTDRAGRTVCEERVGRDGTSAQVLYGYDAMGRLSWVVSPEGSAILHSGSTYGINSQFAERWCYRYVYDQYGRIAEKYIPGASVVYYVYDLGDREVMSQDGLMRNAGKWKVTEYDVFGRPTAERLVTGSATRSSLQTSFDANETPTLYSATGEVLREWYYDDYSHSPTGHGFLIVSGVTPTLDNRTKGLLTVERLNVLGTTDYVWRTYYYDAQGNVMQTVESRPGGATLRTSNSLAADGSPLATSVTYTDQAAILGQSVTLTETYSYDGRGRLLTRESQLMSGNDQSGSSIECVYDDLGRLSQTDYGGSDTAIGHLVMDYTMQGWESSRAASDEGWSPVFASGLQYEKTLYSSGLAPTANAVSYTGRISGWSWRQGSGSQRAWSLAYDTLGRLTDASCYTEGVSDSTLGESATYDLNANITSLTQTLSSNQTSTRSYSYAGNHRTQSSYDANGNVTSTGDMYDEVEECDRSPQVTYNLLNLPSYVDSDDDYYLDIQYLSDGTKIAAIGYEDMGYKYAGPFRYSVEYGDSMLESCVSAGGRIHCLQYDNNLERYVTSMDARYYVPDHLGSTRAVIDGTGAVLWRADYLPYGRCVGVAGSSAAPAKEYMWTGKEKQAMSILSGDWYDSTARYLGTQGQFMSIDPQSEKYPGISPYAYCAGDPVNAVDPEGTNPIYDQNGNFLGTDNLGLQGDAIVMSAEDFVQGMDNEDALHSSHPSLTAAAMEKMAGHFSTLSSRPDYDGIVTIKEGIDWAKSHPGAKDNPTADNSLYIDASKLDFGDLSINDVLASSENNLFCTSRLKSSPKNAQYLNTVYALGKFHSEVVSSDDRTIRVINDELAVYDWNLAESRKRNVIITMHNAVMGINKKKHGFKVYYYGLGKLKQ